MTTDQRCTLRWRTRAPGTGSADRAQIAYRVRAGTDDIRSSHDFGKDVIPRLVPRYRIFSQPFDQSCVNVAGDALYCVMRVPWMRTGRPT